MSTSQLNIRLATDVKRTGDAVLARHGISATEAIRSLWRYLAEEEDLPYFMRGASQEGEHAADTSSVAASYASAALEGKALALRLVREQGLRSPSLQDLSYEDLRELAFEEMLEEGRLHA